MDNYQLEIDRRGVLNYVFFESDGTKSVYEVLGFKADHSLNTRFLYKEKPKKDDDNTKTGEI